MTVSATSWGKQSQRAIPLAVVTVLIAAFWLVVLPRWAERPAMHERLNWLEERGIDPSAMYYTELEAMEAILLKQRKRERSATAKR
ncbi:hypothetical protein [Novipirellula artificiosorum]|uniref:Uncharacterized protein n=1 Tax=Novipirellula artificiosorum TaxID=2528016 RepID=A0A5C6E355_9BACT|nr:hypothetical protein [Novipirellula artificiosorum]TWU42051.1 hypothetical protein Poly41_03470 [Novipirellula artificiosorum]